MKEPESPISSSPNVLVEETTISKRIAFQKQMFLCTNLILLHRPYVNDVLAVRNTSNRPSYDICSYAAVIITDSARKLDISELLYHSKSPMIAYALVMALRVHIMNATSANPEKYNASKNFSLSLATLSKLPQSQDTDSMLHHALIDLERQYNNRFSLEQEREDDNRMQQQLQQQMQMNQPIVTAAQIVFSPGTTEKRKERPGSSDRSVSQSSVQQIDANAASSRNSIVIKDYNHQIDATNKKKKKAKIQQQHQQQQQQQEFMASNTFVPVGYSRQRSTSLIPPGQHYQSHTVLHHNQGGASSTTTSSSSSSSNTFGPYPSFNLATPTSRIGLGSATPTMASNDHQHHYNNARFYPLDSAYHHAEHPSSHY